MDSYLLTARFPGARHQAPAAPAPWQIGGTTPLASGDISEVAEDANFGSATTAALIWRWTWRSSPVHSNGGRRRPVKYRAPGPSLNSTASAMSAALRRVPPRL